MTPPQSGKPRQSARIEMISLSQRIETVATYAWSQKGNYAKISSILFLNEPLHPLHRQHDCEPGTRNPLHRQRLPPACGVFFSWKDFALCLDLQCDLCRQEQYPGRRAVPFLLLRV